MLVVETIARIRRDFFVKRRSIKEISRALGVSRNTVRKVVRSEETAFSYERAAQPLPKLGAWTAQLDAMLLSNESKASRERLTLIRMFEELRALGYEGGYDAVRRYARSWRQQRGAATAAAYVPLVFAPGEAYQFDWSHEIVVLSGATVTLKVAHVRLCHSRMLYVRAYPSQLSGGQRQRVALARALAIEPKILLLDEPFGALDAKVRRELRRWLRDLHERTGLTTIFVTHDQEEALELADRVALLKDGALEQVGTPEELYHEPASAFVFDFLGDSVQLPCTVEGGVAVIAGAGVPIVGIRPELNGAAIAHVRPDGFHVAIGEGAGIAARVRNVLLAGPDARIDCVLDGGEALEVRVNHAEAHKLSPKDRVTLTPRAVRVWP